jgi:hypothetical protein
MSESRLFTVVTRWLVIALVLLPTAAVADEGRKMSLQGQLGTNLYEHQFSSYGMPAMDQTIADKFELILAFALVLAPRASGRNEFGFGVQPSIGTNVKLAEHLHLVFAVQLPIIIEPEPTLQLAPLFGLSYDR